MYFLRYIFIGIGIIGFNNLAYSQTSLPNTKIGSAITLSKPAVVLVNPLPEFTSPYWIAVDYSSQSIIAGKDINLRIAPASMTKVVSAYVIFTALKDGKITKDQKVKAIKNVEGSRMFLDNNDEVKVEDLIRGMIVQSGNDASINLAVAVAGTEENFAKLMNETVKKLGMKNSNFVNASGLPDDNHYTTLSDLSIIAIAVIRDFPEYYSLYSERKFTYGNITQANRNELLFRDIGVDGIKTGHTEAAGFCLMSSAIRGDRRVITVTAKANNKNARFQDSEALINYIYSNTETVKLYDSAVVVDKLPLWKGDKDSVNVGFNSTLYLTIPLGSKDTVTAHINYKQPLLAPISLGDELATLNVIVSGRNYASYNLQALEEVDTAPWYRLAWHNLRLLLK